MSETLEQRLRAILGRCEVPPDGLRLVEHDFLQEIANALAAMSWQPIETAPKNKRVLILTDHTLECDGPVYAARLSDEFHGAGIESWLVDDCKHGPYPLRGYQNVLAWMPLPTPPTTGEKDNRETFAGKSAPQEICGAERSIPEKAQIAPTPPVDCEMGSESQKPTDFQAQIIRTALGLDVAAEPFRSHYTIIPGGNVERWCDEAVSAGWMRRGDHLDHAVTYHITEAGAAAVDAYLPRT